MAEIKDFGGLFRLDGKIAVVTGGESFLSFLALSLLCSSARISLVAALFMLKSHLCLNAHNGDQ